MHRFILAGVALALISGSASAAMVERKTGYEVGGKAFESALVYDDSVRTRCRASNGNGLVGRQPKCRGTGERDRQQGLYGLRRRHIRRWLRTQKQGG